MTTRDWPVRESDRRAATVLHGEFKSEGGLDRVAQAVANAVAEERFRTARAATLNGSPAALAEICDLGIEDVPHEPMKTDDDIRAIVLKGWGK